MTSGFLIIKVANSLYPVEADSMFAHSKKLLHVNFHFKCLSRILGLILQKLLQVALYRPGCIIPGLHFRSTHSRAA